MAHYVSTYLYARNIWEWDIASRSSLTRSSNRIRFLINPRSKGIATIFCVRTVVIVIVALFAYQKNRGRRTSKVHLANKFTARTHMTTDNNINEKR